MLDSYLSWPSLPSLLEPQSTNFPGVDCNYFTIGASGSLSIMTEEFISVGLSLGGALGSLLM